MRESQRDILAKGLGVAAAMAGFAIAGVRWKPPPPDPDWELFTFVWKLLGETSPDGVERGWTALPEYGVLVVQRAHEPDPDVSDMFVAFVAACPCGAGSVHVDGDGIVCDGQGCRFTMAGEHVSGPAPRGLDRRALRMRPSPGKHRGLGEMEINVAEVVPGPPRA